MPPTNPTLQQPQPPTAAQYGNNLNPGNGPRLSRGKLVAALLIVLLLIAAAGIGGFFIGKSQTKTTNSVVTPTAKAPKETAPSPDDSVLSDFQKRAMDTKRETDIRALHGQIEAYFAENGYYPTFANINDKAFRTANLKGFDEASLVDPQGSEALLVRIPAPRVYAYLPTTDDGKTACDNATKSCSKYTLTATLSDGTTYTKSSLN